MKKQISLIHILFSSEREHIINIYVILILLIFHPILPIGDHTTSIYNKNWDPEYWKIFTETFDPKNWARTLGKNLYDAIDIDNDKASSVFPKWDSLCKEHVDDLLRFIGDFNTVIHKEKDGKLVNPYLYESRY